MTFNSHQRVLYWCVLWLLSTAAIHVGTAALAGESSKPAEDPTGKWVWKYSSQNGAEIETTLILKLQDGKLTGIYAGRGRETPIESASFQESRVSFQVNREILGQKWLSKYEGKISGDTIKGTAESNWGGETRTRDWEARRERENANATGTWKWTFKREGESSDITLRLKQEGDKLSGVSLLPGGQETSIRDGAVKGAEISFRTEREFNGQKIIAKYQGKIKEDMITGRVDVESNGETRPVPWEARKVKE